MGWTRRRGFMLKASSTPKPRSTPARVALNATVPLRLWDSGHRNTRLPLEALSGRLGTFPGPGPTDCAFRPTRIQEFVAKRYSRRGGIDEDLASFSRERWESASMMRISCRSNRELFIAPLNSTRLDEGSPVRFLTMEV